MRIAFSKTMIFAQKEDIKCIRQYIITVIVTKSCSGSSAVQDMNRSATSQHRATGSEQLKTQCNYFSLGLTQNLQ